MAKRQHFFRWPNSSQNNKHSYRLNTSQFLEMLRSFLKADVIFDPDSCPGCKSGKMIRILTFSANTLQMIFHLHLQKQEVKMSESIIESIYNCPNLRI